MSTVASSNEKQTLAEELAEASALVEQGDFTGALAALDMVRKRAVTDRDAAVLERVFDLASRVYEQAEGKAKQASGSLMLASVQALSASSQTEAGVRPARVVDSPRTNAHTSGSGSVGAVRRTLVGRWFVLLTLLGAVTWFFYFLQAGSLGGGCGNRFLFRSEGSWEGGPYESAMSAAAMGGVLLGIAAAAGSRFPQRRGTVMLAFFTLYVVALVVLWYLSPAIWGPSHCVIR